ATLLGGEVAAQVLGDLVPEKAVLHPAHDEQVGEGDQRPIRDAVLRSAEAPRPMIDGNLDDAISAHLEELREKPVETPVEREVAQALPAKGPEGAAAVPDTLAAHGVADPVGHPR